MYLKLINAKRVGTLYSQCSLKIAVTTCGGLRESCVANNN